MNNFSSLVTRVGGIILLTTLMIRLTASRYWVARPNEVYIITGRKSEAVTNPEIGLASINLSGQKVIMGGGTFVISLIQRLHALDLPSRRIMVQIRSAVPRQGIKLNPDDVTITGVGGNEDSTRVVAQRFLAQQEEIGTFAQETLTSALQSIVGGLSMEQITCDRVVFTQRVTDESEASLTGQGLVLDTFQIQDIVDDGTCLPNLGRPELTRVSQIAAITEVNTRYEAEQARLAAGQEVTISERGLVLKETEIKAETDAVRAQVTAVGPLAQADRDRVVPTEQEEVTVRRAALKNRQLDTEVRKPADAKRYETGTVAQRRCNSEVFEAEARKATIVTNAEVQAEAARLTSEDKKQYRATFAEAETIEGARRGEAEKARRIAEADVARAEGGAKAAVTLAVGIAEAEAVNKRATTFANYSEAAVLQVLIEVLPQVIEKVAAPIGSIDKLTVVFMGGVAAPPRQINDNALQTVEVIKNTTGIDPFDIPKGRTNGKVSRGETAE